MSNRLVTRIPTLIVIRITLEHERHVGVLVATNRNLRHVSENDPRLVRARASVRSPESES